MVIEVTRFSMYNKAMPHAKTSCREKGSAVLRIELAQLYAKRSAVEAAIQELESRQIAVTVNGDSAVFKPAPEFGSKLSC